MSAKEEKLRRLVMAVVIFICILGWSLTKFARIMGKNVLVAVGITIAVLIISLILVSIILIKRRPRINFYKKIHSIYAKIPLESLIKDYKEELEFARRQFASASSPTKNRIGEWIKRSKEFPDSLFDCDVISQGRICYGFMMDAPRNVFKKSSVKNTLFTGYVASVLNRISKAAPQST